jgi:hypothetical protein
MRRGYASGLTDLAAFSDPLMLVRSIEGDGVHYR